MNRLMNGRRLMCPLSCPASWFIDVIRKINIVLQTQLETIQGSRIVFS